MPVRTLTFLLAFLVIIPLFMDRGSPQACLAEGASGFAHDDTAGSFEDTVKTSLVARLHDALKPFASPSLFHTAGPGYVTMSAPNRILYGCGNGFFTGIPGSWAVSLVRPWKYADHRAQFPYAKREAAPRHRPHEPHWLERSSEGVEETMKNPSLEVLGYYPIDYEGDTVSYRCLESYHENIDSVAVFSHPIDGDGRVTGSPDRALMKFAKEHDTTVLALVHNMRGGAFDRWAAHAVITEPTLRARAVENIFNLVSDLGYHGVNIDLENIAPRDATGYSAFIKELAERLRPEGYLVTASVPAKTGDDPNHGWSGAFDYREIGRWADQVMIMTYDEHWLDGAAGPIASLNWVERVVEYAVSRIPKKKIFMGIAAYGYDWPSWGRGRAFPSGKAAAQAASRGASIQWDDAAKCPYYHYYEGNAKRTVYFENRDSTAWKIDLAKRYGLKGIAIWRLGHEDPGIWKVIKEKTGR